MDPIVYEWLNLVVRWAHVVAAIMWIGDSFLFMWLDRSLQKPEKPQDEAVMGELWMVHGGGFYELVKRKYLKPGELPPKLHWFKWESYSTWITGFLLLVVVYYTGKGAYLVDPVAGGMTHLQAVGASLALLAGGWLVYDFVWMRLEKQPVVAKAVSAALVLAANYGVTQLFSGRAAFLQVGAMLATVMAGNVFFRIIPAQKNMLAATLAGAKVDTSLGVRAKLRSTQNHYVTLPVLFTMLSNHFPSTWGHPHAWVVLSLLMAAGMGVKYFMNFRFQGSKPALALGGASFAAFVVMTAPAPGGPGHEQFAGAAPVEFARVKQIVDLRCLSCHAQQPTDPAFAAPPSGVVFDHPEHVRASADRILVRAVLTKSMPLGNLTGMTDEERAIVGAWVAQGAKLDGASAALPAPPPAEQALARPPAEEAKALFAERCAACHGATGAGDGLAAAALTPRPRAFKDPEWQAAVGDDHLRKVIVEGGAAAGKSPLMPGNPDLAARPEVVEALVALVRDLGGAAR
jgi:uncharacterized membrane protein